MENSSLHKVAPELLNRNVCEQFEKEFRELPEQEQKESKAWIIEQLYKIDNGLFDSKRYVDHPIRFHFNEYRHVLFTHFSDK